MTVSDVSLTPPVWVGEFLAPDKLIPAGGKLDASAFPRTDAVVVTTTAIAAIDAVALAVTALSGPIPSGTILDFGAKKYAQLTAAAATGAVALAVEPLAVALAAADVATYAGTEYATVPSGTVVGRTFAERATDDPYGPAAVGDDEVFLVAFDVTDITYINDATLVKPGVVVKENFLPGWSGLAAGVQTLVRARYVTQLGVA